MIYRKMEKYNKYLIEDFVQDLYFRKWVLGKLPNNLNWERWLRNNQDKQNMIDEAKSLVIASQIEEIEVNPRKIQEGIQEMLNRTEVKIIPIYQQNWFRLAAAIVVILGATLILKKDSILPLLNTEKAALSQATETENNDEQPLNLTLSDGSKVTLKQGSKLQVSPDFGQQNRTVFLAGEAFFEVQKDPSHPFLVYAGGIVTKVLGTSFNIRAYNAEPKTLVAVRTGHVTVYQQEKAGNKSQIHPEQIFLTPNQQVVFEKMQGKLVKTLVEKPIILQNIENSNFEYDETPITKVLTELENAYGVKIIFDTDLLAKCNLTASFSNEPLYDKMEIICETIQARYEIADGQIVIYAKGCK
jgi:transmembrane sensor